MEKSHKFKIGDSVIVKPNVKDEELGIEVDMGGWQGRISEIIPKNNLICIDWDSITLKNIPSSAITLSEEKGFGWNQYYLGIDDVELTSPRDKKADVEKVYGQLQDEHTWDHLGAEGQRIQKVLAGISPDNTWEAFKAWNNHLREVLQFPFKAEVSEFQEHGPLQAGDKVIVEDITDVDDDSYGVIVHLKHKGYPYDFPLCDLEAIDKKSPNYELIEDYSAGHQRVE